MEKSGCSTHQILKGLSLDTGRAIVWEVRQSHGVSENTF